MNDNLNKTILLKLDGFVPQKAIKIVSNDEKKWETTQLNENIMNIELEAKSITTIKYMK